MILEKQKESLVLQEGEQTQESIGMSLDLDSAQILMQMLSKNLYSDAIGSTIRECASNALDSHRRAGIKEAIVVSFGYTTNNTYEFTVEDFGIGLDADDVKNIISKYGKSTKRKSANELGMMGLGFKAPLAYCSSFYFVARKNGIERKYMMYEGEDVNTIDLLYEAPTDKRNGVKIIVPVKSGDKWSFMSKIKEQLAYFEDVYFMVDGIDNDFTIQRHEHFQFSPLASDSNLHICLDNVYYPIDFQKIGTSSIQFPVALRFGLSDGIFPTPNRESIRYTQEAKGAILDKIQKVANYFVEKYNETIEDSEDVKQILDYYSNGERKFKLGNTVQTLNSLMTFTTVKFATPKYKHSDNVDFERLWKMRDQLFGEYAVKFSMHSGRMYSEENNRRYNLQWNEVIGNSWAKSVIMVYSDKLKGVMKDYLRSVYGRQRVKIVRKERSFVLGKLKSAGNGHFDNYINILRLDNYPKSEWRTRIKDFQVVLSKLTEEFINLDELVIPQSFIDARKKQRIKAISASPKRKKLEGEINVKLLSPLERFVYGKNSKLVPTIINLADAHKQPTLTVYGKQEHAELMDKWFAVFPKHIKFIVLSERELRAMKDVKIRNWITMEEFMEGKHIVFRRAATAHLIKKLMNDNEYVFVTNLSDISTDLNNKLIELKDYKKKYRLDGDDNLYDEIISIAQQNNLFDNSIYSSYLNMKDFLDRNRYLNHFLRYISRYSGLSKTDKEMLCDLMKYHRQKLNWQNYKLNEEKLEVPTEETIESLVTI